MRSESCWPVLKILEEGCDSKGSLLASDDLDQSTVLDIGPSRELETDH